MVQRGGRRTLRWPGNQKSAVSNPAEVCSGGL